MESYERYIWKVTGLAELYWTQKEEYKWHKLLPWFGEVAFPLQNAEMTFAWLQPNAVPLNKTTFYVDVIHQSYIQAGVSTDNMQNHIIEYLIHSEFVRHTTLLWL